MNRKREEFKAVCVERRKLAEKLRRQELRKPVYVSRQPMRNLSGGLSL